FKSVTLYNGVFALKYFRRICRKIWDRFFEYDRVGERKVLKSIEIYHRGGVLNVFRSYVMWNKIRREYSCNIFPGITVGENLYIAHASWITIGKTAILGNNIRIYPRVDIIAKVLGDSERNEKNERRHAKIGND